MVKAGYRYCLVIRMPNPEVEAEVVLLATNLCLGREIRLVGFLAWTNRGPMPGTPIAFPLREAMASPTQGVVTPMVEAQMSQIAHKVTVTGRHRRRRVVWRQYLVPLQDHLLDPAGRLGHLLVNVPLRARRCTPRYPVSAKTMSLLFMATQNSPMHATTHMHWLASFGIRACQLNHSPNPPLLLSSWILGVGGLAL